MYGQEEGRRSTTSNVGQVTNAEKMVEEERSDGGEENVRENQNMDKGSEKTVEINHTASDDNDNDLNRGCNDTEYVEENSFTQYEGDEMCLGECDLQLECEKHTGVLQNRYGGGMRCKKKDCGVALWKATTTMGSAYVCSMCKHGKCRYMLCSICFGNQSSGRKRAGKRVCEL